MRRVRTISPDRPFFLYVAPGATHSPHQVPEQWIEPYEGKFDVGWDAFREQTLARQKELGVVPENTDLTERSAGLPAWDTLHPDQKRLYARMMEVFAGYAANVDHEMGRIIEAVKALPGAENTIFIYIAGDNGSSAEGGIEGSVNENLFFNGFPETWQENLEVIDELGGPRHFNHFPSAWAHAMDTPFQWTKQIASHFGGTRNPMIVSWPARIADAGGVRTQFLHTIDIVPTLYEVIGITPPDDPERRHPEADRGHQLRLFLRRRHGSGPPHNAVFRDGRRAGASTTTAGWPRPSLSRPGSRSAPASTSMRRSGSSTTSTRTSPRRTTSRPRSRRGCDRCRTSGGPRRRATTCCRSTGAASSG